MFGYRLLIRHFFDQWQPILGAKLVKLEIISTLLRRIGIPPPTVPPSESLCIKTGNQSGGWVYSRFDHVIHGGLKYTNFLASGRGMSVD